MESVPIELSKYTQCKAERDPIRHATHKHRAIAISYIGILLVSVDIVGANVFLTIFADFSTSSKFHAGAGKDKLVICIVIGICVGRCDFVAVSAGAAQFAAAMILLGSVYVLCLGYRLEYG